MINEVRLLGRLAKDPMLKEFNNGSAVCTLRVITSRSWIDSKTKLRREKIDGHNVVIQVSQIARRAYETLAKGSLVYVAGTLENRSWVGPDNVNRYSTEIVLRPFQGTLRRLPGATYDKNSAGDPISDDVEIDYMSELTDSDTFSLNDAGEENPFTD